MDEKKREDVQELTDEQLEATSGGAISVKRFGHTYLFTGSDFDQAFACPQCSKMLHYTKSGSLEFFRCMSCGRNFTPENANPNFGNGLWIKFF